MKDRGVRIAGIVVICSIMLSGSCLGGGFYRYNVDDLARKARKRLEDIDKKIEEQALKEELDGALAEIQGLFDKAESLFDAGRLDEAARLYEEIEQRSNDRVLKELLQKAGKYH